ncbi:hypothetical protein [Tateyamaria sp. ANG-S1]|uniref:antibiotic biosynthesis monooxygenase family protein n=1 Tax=Tateyamaria sp. ANG-S1 TaxID=1577905 RepID=UPI00057F2D39|nr:hypothetical protein [Tateyamaria sp. ANG-S1]KIC49207.1 hypothetical protein RA29_12345 [Tateyamaria sp. ANG-S1]
MTTTAEIVTFRLLPGSDPHAFAKAAADMEPFLQETGGMISRHLSVDDDGLWTDHILWTSLEAAKSAAAQIRQHPAAEPFVKMIDGPSASMRHAQVHLQQE